MAAATEDVWGQLTRRLFPPPGADNTDSKFHSSPKGAGKYGQESSESDPTNNQEADVAGGEKDIVTVIQAIESYALCVGMPGAGKSSLLNVYLNPSNDGVPKPTVALEYMFARRASAANAPKVKCL